MDSAALRFLLLLPAPKYEHYSRFSFWFPELFFTSSSPGSSTIPATPTLPLKSVPNLIFSCHPSSSSISSSTVNSSWMSHFYFKPRMFKVKHITSPTDQLPAPLGHSCLWQQCPHCFLRGPEVKLPFTHFSPSSPIGSQLPGANKFSCRISLNYPFHWNHEMYWPPFSKILHGPYPLEADKPIKKQTRNINKIRYYRR